ncbi:hypothetical protein SRABI76_01693 [Microbacterium oxydans]|uniref:Uncharacterized protein n=1 Tax=Microbacterium oxydans TaxID=82380 RepID=A0A0F0LFT2_9MICO|nr:hypothetical protein [Microbacterium oxydans]KJL30386.1 hypothetical protein RS83_00772 [Microbacterium oxydans]CAH0187734.1 hypothetical protein SRABI76_01693 [Microbacterium oxydans]
MPRPDWTPHRRDDGELLGWIHPEGDLWVAVDVLGRPASDATEWLDAEAALEEHGIAWLADPWMLEGEGDRPLRVRLLEVTPDDDGAPGRIVVKLDDFGDMTRPSTAQFVLAWPIPDRLRQPRADDPDPREISR